MDAMERDKDWVPESIRKVTEPSQLTMTRPTTIYLTRLLLPNPVKRQVLERILHQPTHILPHLARQQRANAPQIGSIVLQSALAKLAPLAGILSQLLPSLRVLRRADSKRSWPLPATR